MITSYSPSGSPRGLGYSPSTGAKTNGQGVQRSQRLAGDANQAPAKRKLSGVSGDEVSISEEAYALCFGPKCEDTKNAELGLDPAELQEVQRLAERDREVRAHEQAHLAAAGAYATSGAKFTYEKGPDGKSYAVGGAVEIDAAPVADDPKASLEKAEQVRRAALAPASPSGADRAVAQKASAIAQDARAEIAAEGAQGEDGGQRGEPAFEISAQRRNADATYRRSATYGEPFPDAPTLEELSMRATAQAA